jgi:hypothetical protein
MELVDAARWPAWPPHLYRIARRRFEAEARRGQMQRLAELDPRFAADIGLTADEVAQGRLQARANEIRVSAET